MGVFRARGARQPQPLGAGADPMDTAARVLALAQQTADTAIADAKREAERIIAEARKEADDIRARALAEQPFGPVPGQERDF
jgi:cell division septum initiation protein DivIVA